MSALNISNRNGPSSGAFFLDAVYVDYGMCLDAVCADYCMCNVKLSIFLKHVDTIQVSFRYDENNGYFTERTMYINDISLKFLE